ncbi:predicted protein [Nematostella vectensis]|uniref:Swi5-dependent recombination DNA repair protein 1 homolog n=1 Tax=Nematostella vectensis TaxID=45351 RepID=A7RT67_NEMVE|nr:swi5-dependent recombination DNA repair protein 1 homolog [Nematostella vectensis]EDO45407.1 predicted protein [Nematostella vectensis]|eukprot:XP_001637470.1 predicted protein [Nematostella vectensis]
MDSPNVPQKAKASTPCSRGYRIRAGVRSSPATSRPFVSPVLKRPSQTQGNHPTTKKPRQETITGHDDKNEKELQKPDLEDGNHVNVTLTRSGLWHSPETNKNGLLRQIAEREDKLRKLKMVKMYRTKNDLTDLQKLIDKWRNVSQEAAERLLTKIKKEPSPKMKELLDQFQIDYKLIGYSEEEEGFV